MTESEINCAIPLLEEHFGPIVSKVADALLRNGHSTLRMVVFFCRQTLANVKTSLRILIHHQFVSYDLNQKGQLEYELDVRRVLCINRYGRFIQIGCQLDSQFGSLIVRHLLCEGQLRLSELIELIVDELVLDSATSTADPCTLPRLIYQSFSRFVGQSFVTRSAHCFSNEEQKKEAIIRNESVGIGLPEINFQLIDCRKPHERSTPNVELVGGDLLGERPPKRLKTEQSNGGCDPLVDRSKQSDHNIYWQLNLIRFNQHICDQLTIKAVYEFYEDERAAEIARIMFRLNQNRNPHLYQSSLISSSDIVKEALRSDNFSNVDQVSNYLQLFHTDNKFISRKEDTSDGGKYVVDSEYAIEELVKNSVASLVKDIYGAKSARLFRLLCIKKFLQQKQLGEDAMLSAKDAKERSFSLFKDGFIKVLQFGKTPEYAPLKTCFVFTVDLKEVVNSLLQRCYHGMYAMTCKRTSELQQNQALLEKKKLIDAIVENLSNQEDAEEQIEELNQSFTTHEREQLTRLEQLGTQTRMAECQLDETVLLFQSWLAIKSNNPLNVLT